MLTAITMTVKIIFWSGTIIVRLKYSFISDVLVSYRRLGSPTGQIINTMLKTLVNGNCSHFQFVVTIRFVLGRIIELYVVCGTYLDI